MRPLGSRRRIAATPRRNAALGVFVRSQELRNPARGPGRSACDRRPCQVSGRRRVGHAVRRVAQAPGFARGERETLPKAFALARRRGVHVVLIPNLDWSVLQGSTSAWVRGVKRTRCQVWAKTAKIA